MGQVYKNAGIEAARIAGLSPEMDAQAAKAKAVVLGVLASHNKTGSYARRVAVRNVAGQRGVRDRVVEARDPQAMAIEYGHWWVTPEGRRIKWVRGIRVFNRAYDILKKG